MWLSILHFLSGCIANLLCDSSIVDCVFESVSPLCGLYSCYFRCTQCRSGHHSTETQDPVLHRGSEAPQGCFVWPEDLISNRKLETLESLLALFVNASFIHF